MAVATATIAAGAIAAGGSMYAASQSSKAQAGADAANAQNTANTNAINYQMFREGRGALNNQTGYANALLPEYFKGQEARLGRDATAQYNSILNQSAGLSSDLRTALGLSAPAQQASFEALMGRYNGANLAQYLNNAQPTFDGRINLAQSQMSGIDTGLRETIGGLNAQRASQGFLGGSTFDQARLAAASIGARQQAGNVMASAQLANAQDERTLRDTDLIERQDMSALNQGFQNWASLQAAPLQQQIAGYQAAMAPYSFFRMGNQAFQAQNAPQISPTISTGQALGQVAGSLGGAGLNYFLNRSLMNQYGAPQQQPAYMPAPSYAPTSSYTGFNNNTIPLQF